MSDTSPPNPHDHPIILSMSGGKDSTAMALHMKDLGLPFRAVFLDTGWEHAKTYDYLRTDLPGVIGQEIEWYRAEIEVPEERMDLVREVEGMLGLEYSAMVRLCVRKGMFSSRQVRWCTQSLKTEVIRDVLAASPGSINAVGIRHEESARRAKMAEWEHVEYYGGWVWRPLVEWSMQDVVDIHTRHGVKPNPLYLERAERVGCWPCIYARKSELAWMAESDPGRVAVMRRLEEIIGDLAEERHIAKGTTLSAEGYSRPAWFQNRKPVRRETGEWRCRHCDEKVPSIADTLTHACTVVTDVEPNWKAVTTRTGNTWPIDKVLDWATTPSGGQFEMFASTPEDTGCMRWGLCESKAVVDG